MSLQCSNVSLCWGSSGCTSKFTVSLNAASKKKKNDHLSLSLLHYLNSAGKNLFPFLERAARKVLWNQWKFNRWPKSHVSTSARKVCVRKVQPAGMIWTVCDGVTVAETARSLECAEASIHWNLGSLVHSASTKDYTNFCNCCITDTDANRQKNSLSSFLIFTLKFTLKFTLQLARH